MDSMGVVYITEISVHRASVFSANRVCVMSKGQVCGQLLQEPCRAVVNMYGHVYVCNQRNENLAIFLV